MHSSVIFTRRSPFSASFIMVWTDPTSHAGIALMDCKLNRFLYLFAAVEQSLFNLNLNRKGWPIQNDQPISWNMPETNGTSNMRQYTCEDECSKRKAVPLSIDTYVGFSEEFSSWKFVSIYIQKNPAHEQGPAGELTRSWNKSEQSPADKNCRKHEPCGKQSHASNTIKIMIHAKIHAWNMDGVMQETPKPKSQTWKVHVW